jgi:hypothetical protein
LQSIPERFSFANAQGGFPPEVIMSRDSRSANGHDWPSADKINETLAKMHSAKTEMNNAWQRSSPIERDALQPPPGIAKRY